MNVHFSDETVKFRKYNTNKFISGYRMIIEGDDEHSLVLGTDNILYDVRFSYGIPIEKITSDDPDIQSKMIERLKDADPEQFFTKYVEKQVKKYIETENNKQKETKNVFGTYKHTVYDGDKSCEKSIVLHKEKISCNMFIRNYDNGSYYNEMKSVTGYHIVFEVFLDQDIEFAVTCHNNECSITETKSGLNIAVVSMPKSFDRTTMEDLIKTFEENYNTYSIIKSEDLRSEFDKKLNDYEWLRNQLDILKDEIKEDIKICRTKELDK